MGFLRGLLVFFMSAFLTFSLVLGGFALMLYISTGNENFKSQISGDISSVLTSQTDIGSQIDSALPEMKIYCQTHSEFAVNSSQLNVSIPCSAVNNGSLAVINEVVGNLISQEKTVSKCDSPANCFFKFKDLFLSDQAKTYWRTTFLIFAFVSFALLAAIFFMVENGRDFPITSGIIFIFSSIPFLVIKLISPYFENSIIKPALTLFSGAFTVFIIIFSVGIILVAVGIALKFVYRNSGQKKK